MNSIYKKLMALPPETFKPRQLKRSDWWVRTVDIDGDSYSIDGWGEFRINEETFEPPEDAHLALALKIFKPGWHPREAQLWNLIQACEDLPISAWKEEFQNTWQELVWRTTIKGHVVDLPKPGKSEDGYDYVELDGYTVSIVDVQGAGMFIRNRLEALSQKIHEYQKEFQTSLVNSALAKLGTDLEHVTAWLKDMPRDNWSMRPLLIREIRSDGAEEAWSMTVQGHVIDVRDAGIFIDMAKIPIPGKDSDALLAAIRIQQDREEEIVNAALADIGGTA